jgi:DNA-binding CsgD family transcriptional regulator
VDSGVIDEEAMLTIVDGFSDAALDNSKWNQVLHQFAAASGSRCGQLVGFSPDGPHFNWMGGTEPGWLEELTRLGGSDPAINPRLEAGLSDPILKPITDSDIVSPRQRRSHYFYAEVLPQMGVPYICATVLYRESGLNVGLAVGRTAQQGEITNQQREVFSSLARHARTAIRTQLLLEGEGSKLITGALEAASVTAFMCDRSGRVKAMTPSAEALIGKGQPLRLQNGVLRNGSAARTRELAAAIERAAAGHSTLGAAPATTLIIRSDSGAPLIIDVTALPRRAHNFGFQPRVLVIVRGGGERTPDQALLLRSLFGLTRTEAIVAASLGNGASLEEIAQARQRSLETIRVQIRSIYAKLGVRRQAELVALLGQFR